MRKNNPFNYIRKQITIGLIIIIIGVTLLNDLSAVVQSETFFCQYCRGKLDLKREQKQGYHYKCQKELDKFFEYSFLIEKDQIIVKRIKSILKVPSLLNNTNTEIRFTNIHDSSSKNGYFNLILSSSYGDLEINSTSIVNVEWLNIELNLLQKLWKLLKKTQIGTPDFFNLLKEKDKALAMKIRDLFIFPKFSNRNNIITISTNEIFITNDYYYIYYNNVITEREYVNIFLSSNSYDKIVTGLNFSSQIATKIKTLPNFFKILERNMLKNLHQSEKEFIKNLKQICHKINLTIKIEFNNEFETIRVVMESNKKKKRKKKELHEKNATIVDLRLKSINNYFIIDELILWGQYSDNIGKIFSNDWQNLNVTKLTINEDNPENVQNIINKMQLAPVNELKLKVNTKESKIVYDLDLKHLQGLTLENFSFEANTFFNIINFSVFKNIKNIKLFNANLKRIDSKINLEWLDLSGTKELTNSRYILPNKIVNLRIDLSVISKIAIRNKILIKKIFFYQNQTLLDNLIMENNVEKIGDIIKLAKGIEHVIFSNDCSVLKGVFEKNIGLKTLTIKNPTSFRNEPTGSEKGLKDLKELIMEEPWFMRVPNFIGKLKGLREITLNFKCFYDMGPGLADIHELNVFKQLPLLETIKIKEKYVLLWIESFQRIGLKCKITTF